MFFRKVPPPPPAAPGPVVMLVEDDLGVCLALTTWLRQQRLRVVHAASRVEALELLGDMNAIQERFDGLVTDYRLPDGTGCDVVRAFRKAHPELPAALITAYAEPAIFGWTERNNVALFEKPLNLKRVQDWLGAFAVSA